MPQPPNDPPVWALPVVGQASAEPLSEAGWETLPTDVIAHLPIGDLVLAYAQAGVPVRLQVHRG